MATGAVSAAFDADNHLLLEQPLLRVPYELARKNFKTAQRQVERERDTILGLLKSGVSSSTPLASLDAALIRANTLKARLESLQAEETTLHFAQRARIEHLAALHAVPNAADPRYEDWAQTRLDRLIVDYLLRTGYGKSAARLATEKGIEKLVDVNTFVVCHQIAESLLQGRTSEALAWCAENRQALKKSGQNLEYELRFQQYIELVRSRSISKLLEATVHARKYLSGGENQQESIEACGLLAYPPTTMVEPYKSMYSSVRWKHLARIFVTTHHSLLSLPTRSALYVALSAGLSALKTPACHSAIASSSGNANSSSGTSLCPICSTELNELARGVPYAHHTKSNVESDPVVLPNGRIYGRDRLMQFNEKMPPGLGKVRDPTDPTTVFDENALKKVFIL